MMLTNLPPGIDERTARLAALAPPIQPNNPFLTPSQAAAKEVARQRALYEAKLKAQSLQSPQTSPTATNDIDSTDELYEDSGFQPTFRIHLNLQQHGILLDYKKLLKRWEREQEALYHASANEAVTTSKPTDTAADTPMADNSAAPTNGTASKHDGEVIDLMEMEDDSQSNGDTQTTAARASPTSSVEADSDAELNSSDEELSSDSDDDSVQDQPQGRRRRQMVEDYDATDPFIDDSGIMDDEDEADDVLSGADEEQQQDVLSTFVALQGKLKPKADAATKRAEREQQAAERMVEKSRKKIAKQAKQHEYPEQVQTLLNELKELAHKLGALVTVSSDPNDKSTVRKRIPTSLIPILTQLEQAMNQHMPSKDHKLVYTRIHRLLPAFSEKTLRNRMKTENKREQQQGVMKHVDDQLNNAKRNLRVVIDADSKRYESYLAEKPRKSVGNVKVTRTEVTDATAAAGADGSASPSKRVEHSYNPEWNDFTELLHSIINHTFQRDMLLSTQSGKSLTADESSKLRDKVKADVLKDVTSWWPNSIMSYQKIVANYNQYLRKLSNPMGSMTPTRQVSAQSPKPRPALADLASQQLNAVAATLSASPTNAKPTVPASPAKPAASAAKSVSKKAAPVASSPIDSGISHVNSFDGARPVESTQFAALPPESERWGEKYFNSGTTSANSSPNKAPIHVD